MLIDKFQKYCLLSEKVLKKTERLDEQYLRGLYRTGQIPADYGIKVLKLLEGT